MLKRFVADREAYPGEEWRARFSQCRSETERWYRGTNRSAPRSAAECRAALLRHMPELMPLYDCVCALVGNDELAHQMLSHYRPPPIPFGCTQAVWLGDEGPALVRNYDFAPGVVSDRFESTSWFGHEVIAKAQRPWGGCLDGMNADGLVASATTGGSSTEGLGFSIILILRYVLETCNRVADGISALRRIPVALSQNVTLLDASGAHATVFLGPDRVPNVSRAPVCANHQDSEASLVSAERTGTLVREDAALRALRDPDMTLSALTSRFLAAPLYSRRAPSPTIYTAVYRPAERRVDYLWPEKRWVQRIGAFEAGEYIHDYGSLIAS